MSMFQLPDNPYVGQIFYNPDSEKTYEFCECTKTDVLTGLVTDGPCWIDITDKDLVP